MFRTLLVHVCQKALKNKVYICVENQHPSKHLVFSKISSKTSCFQQYTDTDMMSTHNTVGTGKSDNEYVQVVYNSAVICIAWSILTSNFTFK